MALATKHSKAIPLSWPPDSYTVRKITGWTENVAGPVPSSCVLFIISVLLPHTYTDGASTGESSSPCGTPCIVGIVLAILGVLILAAILAGVAYAVYSYMNHPDTKLSKYDADKING